MELIQIVNEEGNFTGQILDKDEAHNRNLLHNEVAAFIINDNNQVLLQRRSSSKRFNPNKWALCAGHVDANESLKSAILREIKEEIGLELREDEIFLYKEREISIRDKNSHITYYYYAKSNKSEDDFIIQKEELSEVKWFNIKDVILMIKNHDENTVFGENRLQLFEELLNL